MNRKFILSIDQGTTGSRAILVDKTGFIHAAAQKEFRQIFPKNGWVEHNPEEIWKTQEEVISDALRKGGIHSKDVAGIGITNQRETTVLWDRETGKPLYNAIVWQDRRTSEYCDQLKKDGWAEKIQHKTGLVIDSYFSATKIKWILDHVDGARSKAESGKIAFGTIDSWLIWNLTKGEKHITDVSNASRTMIYNIQDKEWDKELLELFEIPESILPEVKSSSEIYGNSVIPGLEEIPIAGIAGDQQAALFGQMCTQKGMLKNTYGTGSFIMFNTGNKQIQSDNNLLSTIAWKIEGKTTYALEGSIFMAGAIIQWLRDNLGIIKNSDEVEKLANSVADNGGVYFVPAFAGMGAPHWDQYARASIFGMSRGTKAGHIARAALEAIAFQVKDVLSAMQADSGISIKELRVDGGASVNNTLMQFQADILGIPVIRPKNVETTAMGAAYLAGLATGFWKSTEDIKEQWEAEQRFEPEMKASKISALHEQWLKGVERSKKWL